MRKIEKQLIEAIKAKTNFNKDNSQVVYCELLNSSDIFLHGKRIATYWHGSAFSNHPLAVDRDTLKRWPTNTTKSRLRALGVSITQKKGVLYIDGVAI